MKISKIITLLICLGGIVSANAQNAEVKSLTEAYYGIKNALVADEGAKAGNSARDFLQALEAIPEAKLEKAGQKAWATYQSKMQSAGEAIAQSEEVSAQREQLNDLSTALFAFLKEVNANDDPVFYQYCPMKKAYWLSNEQAIKNPYYGNKMLTCGSVKETLD